MRVVFFHRRPRLRANFSVESLFRQIRAVLPTSVTWDISEASYFSNGFFKRLYIGIEAAFRQRDVNHITGDINFVAIFLRKKRTVLTVLDVGLMNNPNWFARMILKWFWIILPVKRCAIVTTISGSTKTELLKYVNANPDKVKVVYVPISPQFVPQPKAFNKVKPVILQIGTKPNKNVVRLVRALDGISCRLEIVGEVDQSLKKELELARVDYSASKNLTDQEILDKYHGADIVSFVSTYEGFGMPIVEANAVGRVVITSNLLSMPEVAGDAAHLVNPFDVASIRSGLVRIIEDDAYRNLLIEKGFRNRMRFDVVAIARQYSEIYDQLYASGISKPPRHEA